MSQDNQESLPEFGQTDQPEVPSEVNDESLASPFLSKIPAQDREVVGRYIKDWDAGVTKKFQEIHGKYKPYTELGEVEELAKYRQLAYNLNANPERFFKLMWDGLHEQYGDSFDTELLRILELEAQQMSDEQEFVPEQEYSSEPDPVQQNMMQELSELREWREQVETEKFEAEQDRQLDTVLEVMHNRYGDFDDRVMVQFLAQHGDPNKAIEDWQKTIGKYSQGAQRQAPKVLGGQGGVPSGSIDPKALRGKERRDLVNAWLEAASEQ